MYNLTTPNTENGTQHHKTDPCDNPIFAKETVDSIPGTAPLTGERAQRDFPRSSSWTLRHVGIRQRPGTGTPSWTFGQGGLCHRLPTGTSSSLRLDPRCRSDLVP